MKIDTAFLGIQIAIFPGRLRPKVMNVARAEHLPDESRYLTRFDLVDQKPATFRKTVLLAEDMEDLRQVMQCTLQHAGYLVHACADGQLATSAFRDHPSIDLLLTDFDMPGMTGIQLARELTSIRPSLPVVFVTGSLLSEQLMEEIRDRHWIYLTKPCRLSFLFATLEQMLHIPQGVSD